MAFRSIKNDSIARRGPIEEDIYSLYHESDSRFHVLASAAGLSPKSDFKNRNLQDLNFKDADLRGYDFSGSILTGTGLRHAAIVDNTTKFEGSSLDFEDAYWLERANKHDTDWSSSKIASEFAVSLKERRVELLVQPKLHLREQAVVGFECLCRWYHPSRGTILPEEFIPALEKEGMLDQFTLFTIDTALEIHRSIIEYGSNVPIFVNISPEVLLKEELIRLIISKVSQYPKGIGLEYSEHAVIMDPDQAISSLKKLANAGVLLAIDNYGASYSSLLYLKEMPAHELKIDRMFISNLTTSTRNPLVVRSTIDLAHALDMSVTACGVEQASDLALLSVMGCDAVQGFFVSLPVSATDIPNLLKSNVSLKSPKRRVSGLSKKNKDYLTAEN